MDTSTLPAHHARVALVTGGGTGIGRGIALGLARRGVHVALVGRRRAPLEATAADVRRLGVRAVAIDADISSASGRRAALEAARFALGSLDLLVHNAGTLAGGELHGLDEDEIASAVATNLTAPLLLTRAALPDLLARGGAVVLVGSGTSFVPLPAASVYSATKAGLRAFGEALRYELEPRGVRVLLVYPPATDTALIAGMADVAGMHYRLARAEEIGERVVAALDAGRRELRFSGPERALSIGYHLAPRLVRWGLSRERERFSRMMAAPRGGSRGEASPAPRCDAPSRTLRERLHCFRRTHPPAHARLHGHEWSYLRSAPDACPSAPAILLLPGAPGQAEHCFAYFEAFEGEYRVLCPSYPSSIRRLDELADGAIALLRHEGVARVHLLGGSYGSMLAQAIARREPELVVTLMLEHPGAPHPTRARLAPLYLALARGIPMSLLRHLIALVCRPYLREMMRGRAFWQDCFRTLIAGLSRQDCLARLAVLLDYDRGLWSSASGAVALSAPVLLVEAQGDKLISRHEREQLRACYPRARVVTVAGATHVGALETPERYIAVFRAFLSEASEESAEATPGGGATQ